MRGETVDGPVPFTYEKSANAPHILMRLPEPIPQLALRLRPKSAVGVSGFLTRGATSDLPLANHPTGKVLRRQDQGYYKKQASRNQDSVGKARGFYGPIEPLAASQPAEC